MHIHPKAKKIFFILLPFVVPIIFFCFTLSHSLSSNPYEYNPDEGLYLMRSVLQQHGLHLYSDIWMDTPPFLVLALTATFKIFGTSLIVGRLLISAFMTLLLWSLYKIIEKSQGHLPAFICCLFIGSYDAFFRHGISVMGIIPSLSLVVTSFYTLLLFDTTHKKRYLFISGALFACAIMTRVYEFLFMPGVLYQLFISARTHKNHLKEQLVYAFRCMVHWMFAFSVVAGSIFYFSHVDISQILDIYARAQFAYKPGGFLITQQLIRVWPLFALFFVALYYLRPKYRTFIAIPISGFIFSMIAFYYHGPVWVYYIFLPLICICWIASLIVFDVYESIREQKHNFIKLISTKNSIVIGLVLMFIITIPQRVQDIIFQLNFYSANYTPEVKIINQYKKENSLIVTNASLLAFLTQTNVPSNFLSSQKQMASGLITEDDYKNVITEMKPDFIFVNKYLVTIDLSSTTQAYTTMFADRHGARLYVANSLNPQPPKK